jgi:hypothetical protein
MAFHHINSLTALVYPLRAIARVLFAGRAQAVRNQYAILNEHITLVQARCIRITCITLSACDFFVLKGRGFQPRRQSEKKTGRL